VWYLFTDVSGQRIGPIFNGLLGLLTLEDGAYTCPETSVNNYHTTPEERRYSRLGFSSKSHVVVCTHYNTTTQTTAGHNIQNQQQITAKDADVTQ
jgi:hypothetical protein